MPPKISINRQRPVCCFLILFLLMAEVVSYQAFVCYCLRAKLAIAFFDILGGKLSVEAGENVPVGICGPFPVQRTAFVTSSPAFLFILISRKRFSLEKNANLVGPILVKGFCFLFNLVILYLGGKRKKNAD